MNLQQWVELRLKRDFSQLLTLAVMLGVVLLLLRLWNRQASELDRSVARIVQGRVVTSVNLARVSWMQQGRPQRISWSVPGAGPDGASRRVMLRVNDRGWPEPGNDCSRWWTLMMGRELSDGDFSVNGDRNSCRVSFQSQPFLRYDSATGSVILLSGGG
ncbi:hypothetical protein FCL40_01235 [Ferrimonas sediminicola]|uniref:MSHA biogenesis protein MshF n=1 Tax=Ferrimonas sediminicola TaxID=2569538 RepID=A0A4U1BIL7_9GAMM|nr:hypothetical protein [Ferrimonas sediminicola]TKB51209.1 hypothetical protein FCL40_01235 [Ferrimonas sediminicola]